MELGEQDLLEELPLIKGPETVGTDHVLGFTR